MSEPVTQVILPTRRTPKLPTAFWPGFAPPATFPDLEGLAARLATLAGDRPVSFCVGAAAYDGFDTFPAVTVYAGGAWLATACLPGVTADTAREALARALGVHLDSEAA